MNQVRGKSDRVVVVGAGLGGLATAMRLAAPDSKLGTESFDMRSGYADHRPRIGTCRLGMT